MATTNLYLGSLATTGDMKNNMSKLLREIRNMKLEVQLDIQGYVIRLESLIFQFHLMLLLLLVLLVVVVVYLDGVWVLQHLSFHSGMQLSCITPCL